MDKPDDSLLCPITLELFNDPVLAQDGHTYEREAIIEWIQKNGRSPITDQKLSLEHLYPNYAIKKAVDHFEKSMKNKNYQYILDIDVKRRSGRPLFQTFGKTIYYAEWLPTNKNRPEIILLKIDGARAKKEASFYVDLSRHPHIVRTYGFVYEENDEENNAIMLLQEHASMGSLFDLLQERKKAPNENILIEIFLQIIDAMIFLSFNGVVHADLACRNVLVFRFDENIPRNNIVKITDFGLSRHSNLYSLSPGAAKTTLNIIPTRYVAPEILSKNVTPDDYTEKSDIYSMGVLMWEAYSRGAIPWSKISEDNEVTRRIINGEFLPKPSNCSESYWSIICKTWAKLPKDRPTFAELKHLLTKQYYDTSPIIPHISMCLVIFDKIILTIKFFC
jgi:serine/threonine protein kinase